MPCRKLELTWHKARGCWKKHYRGKTLYLGKEKCRSKSDRMGYQLALEEWRRIKQSIVETVDNSLPFNPNAVALMATDYRALGVRRPVHTTGTTTERRIKSLIESFILRQRERQQRGEISVSTYAEYRDNPSTTPRCRSPLARRLRSVDSRPNPTDRKGAQ